ncbi:murein transglycosylase [Bacteroidales bacterium]|nr:murein transglycosylase [Bacteroidales bacterium]
MMKVQHYVILFGIVAGFLCLAFVGLGSTDSQSVEAEKPKVLSLTVSVSVPESMSFCDKDIDLTRNDMREDMDRELNAFTYYHSTTLLLIKRANKYFPILEPILKEEGIPDDLKYLAVIESHLNTRALSPAKAAGFWQLMPATAKSYGLVIDEQVDERYHIEKSTRAACKYLKEAYRKYGDWATVSASYNGGMGRISGELKSQQVDTTFDLLLVEETSRYVYRIMAAREIFSNPPKYGFVLKKENLYQPIGTKSVEVKASIDNFATYAKTLGLTYAQLKDFNPWLRDRKLIIRPGKTYVLDIPNKEDLYFDKEHLKVHNKAWLVD